MVGVTFGEEAAMTEPRTSSAGADHRTLPERIPFDQMVATQPASDPPSPTLGRDPETEWLLRFGIA